MMKIIKPELGSDVKSIGYRVDLLEGKFTNSPIDDNQEIETVKEEKVENPKPKKNKKNINCLLYTSPSPRDGLLSRMPSSA